MLTRFKFFLPFLAVSLLLVSSPGRADFVGFSIGATYWTPDLSGNFNSTGGSAISLSDDLGVDDPSPSSLVLSLEHPVPLLPNIRYQNIELDSSGRNILTSNITFEGQTYSAGETVDSDFDLSHDQAELVAEYMLSLRSDDYSPPI